MRKTLYAVMGNPVLQSRSPAMQQAAFAATQVPAAYLRLHAESAAEGLRVAQAMGIRGLNVTAPFKESIVPFVTQLDRQALSLRAVNTIRFDDEHIAGFNTDVEGLRQSLSAEGIDVHDQRVVVLGTGGAARAAISALRAQGAAVVVAGRSLQHATALAKTFRVTALSLDAQELAGVVCDAVLLVSCLSTIDRVVPPQWLHRDLTVFDIHYGRPTRLLTDARARGCRTLDGREWLLHQGGEAFECFTGKEAPTACMRQAVFAEDACPSVSRPIALIGMMGAGKSVIAAAVASRSGRQYLDMDTAIAATAGCSIAELFATKGEGDFRALERQQLTAYVETSGSVIACGGGVVLEAANRALLRAHCHTIWLWAAPEVLAHRTRDDTRPLLAGQDRSTALRTLLHARMEYYVEVADMVISTEEESPEHVAEAIDAEVCCVSGC
ncbi:MAG: NAD(P)-binding domain-containing protein [Deltaproteobacteria bacterium]|nr:NAD(P)-binding domain-containing protein [Deltaproteobacteria bacterium]